jgi:serine/threonine-protein kinase ULK4
LKPSTILINEYSKLKLSDFGVARKTTDFMNPAKESQSPSKQGSPFYMAPELFQEGGVYSFASDIWSLGCILFEIGSGQTPF